MNVTDFKWYDDKWDFNRIGYFMDDFLAMNLNGVPNYLNKDYDVVGIISGHGKVRAGKSTIAQQIGYYLAWLLAGGTMGYNEKTKKWFVLQKPTKPVRFNLEDNIVFSPDDLQKNARELYEKYGKGQVIIYDEGRSGLDSSAAMSSINKGMQDFFQECGQYNHVILIVLPDFFKLHADYAISRSIFLVDVFTHGMRRGFFKFYNESQKEFLFISGKKTTGTKNKYDSVKPSFSGNFSHFLPLDKDKYEEAKKAAIKQKEVNKREQKWKRQRDALLYLYYETGIRTPEEINDELEELVKDKIGQHAITLGINNIKMERGEERIKSKLKS